MRDPNPEQKATDFENRLDGEQTDGFTQSRRGMLQASGAMFGASTLLNGQFPTSRNNEQIMTRNVSQDVDDIELRTIRQVPLSLAEEILDAMEEEAEEIGVPSVLTVTDAEGNMIAQRRMNNAWLPSVNISRNKAYTAAGFEMPTENLSDVTTPGESLWGLHVTDESRIVVFGGGIPLVEDDEVVGAVGSSGGTVEQDIEVAEAGVDRFEEIVD